MPKNDPRQAIKREAGQQLCPIGHIRALPPSKRQGLDPARNAEQLCDRQHMAYEVVRLEGVLDTEEWRRIAEAKRKVAAMYECSEKTVANALKEFRAEAEANLDKYVELLKQRGYL